MKHICSINNCKMINLLQETGYIKGQKGYIAKRKNYESILIFDTYEGKGQLRYNNKSYIIDPSHYAIINCKKPQLYFTDNQKNMWNFTFLHFKSDRAFEIVDYLISRNGPLFKKTSPFLVSDRINQITNLKNQTGPHIDILISRYIDDILYDLLSHTMNNMNVINIPDQIKNIRKHLIDNYDKSVNLDSISETFYINKYEIIRQFKKYYQLTPMSFLIEYRIAKAKQLLETTNINIDIISANCGFSNTSYFIKVFKSKETLTPHKYREFWRIKLK